MDQSQDKKKIQTITTVQRQQSTGCLSAFMRPYNSAIFLQDKINKIEIAQRNHQFQKKISKSNIFSQDDQLIERYDSIQDILINENQNLKKQTYFLVSQARKSLKREKQQREDMKQLHELYQSALQELQHVTKKNIEIHKYVEDKVKFISVKIQASSISDIINEIKYFIQDFCEFFQINLEQNIIRVQNLDLNLDLHLQNDAIKIEELNDKFEALMYEYRTSKQPQLRKKCIQIAKEIKQLKQSRVITSQKDSSVKIITPRQSKIKIITQKLPLTSTFREESLAQIHTLKVDKQETISNYDEQYPQKRSPQKQTPKSKMLNHQRNNSCSLLKNSSFLKNSKAD